MQYPIAVMYRSMYNAWLQYYINLFLSNQLLRVKTLVSIIEFSDMSKFNKNWLSLTGDIRSNRQEFLNVFWILSWMLLTIQKKVLNVVFEIFLVYPENKHIRVMRSELHLKN